ncbi:hypothetical protein ACLNGX_02840 [Bacillus velezensis]|uniref:hypothetical protein n=1 Tax=Bacillus amyloliquefaciens group TaxID=1938374 RepID=UPI000CA33B69|nr:MULTISPECIES: hypothetical protein [Bacillus amyloliquefaciens group]AUJ61422.1 hypothetical protein B6257_12955 [Bacillus velezensis]MCC9265394.1 hypothetical protein [Bacillus velezensis]NIH02485.1 hypothetical protein [Bacillus amyloliquefaciens]UYP23438.1 hypothetical protein OF857_02880 [Bacillus velezensis]
MISPANTMLLKAEKQPALMTNIPVITNRTLTGATNLVPFREIIRLTLNRPINEPNASPYITNLAKAACEQSRRLFFLSPAMQDRRGR